jgi:hypothetical protein
MSSFSEQPKDMLVKRLEACTETLAAGDCLDIADSHWVAAVLQSILSGEDVRFHFYSRAAAGRPAASEAWEFWMTVQALRITATSGKKGKALWAMLGEKWGFSDGSVKNAITRQRDIAQITVDALGWEEALKKARAAHIKHKKSQN